MYSKSLSNDKLWKIEYETITKKKTKMPPIFKAGSLWKDWTFEKSQSIKLLKKNFLFILIMEIKNINENNIIKDNKKYSLNADILFFN